ncbi:MAG: hypothetical protein WCF84_23110 [Anaerolineae bacterium]
MTNLVWIGAAVLVILTVLLVLRWRKARDELAVRAPLRSEIDSNLDRLRAYWEGVRPRESSEDEVHSLQKRRYAREFASTPLPHFAREAYQSHLAFLSTAGNRREFIAATNLYADLARLEEMQRELQASLAAGESARQIANGPTPTGQGGDYAEFLHIAGRVWDDVWRRIERLLEQGNPIK